MRSDGQLPRARGSKSERLASMREGKNRARCGKKPLLGPLYRIEIPHILSKAEVSQTGYIYIYIYEYIYIYI